LSIYEDNQQNLRAEPEAFQQHQLRPEYRAALRGDLTGLKAAVAYELSGGGRVKVYREENQSTYAAVVKLDGIYPEAGKIARNKQRTEKIRVLEGHFEVCIDSKKHKLKSGNSVLVPDGSHYRITGTGTCFTLVHDDKDGQTEIIDDMD